jgi:hypothetical protein
MADHRDGRIGRNRPGRIGALTFSGKDRGELAFLAVEADLAARDGADCAEFSWEGFDDGTAASGRGWAALGGAGRLVGHIFIHKGDDSGFVAERE